MNNNRIPPSILVDPLNLANELISLGEQATDEGRESEPYFAHAERILDLAEAGHDATHAVNLASRYLGRCPA